MDISGLKMENTECNIILDNLSREKVKLTFRLIFYKAYYVLIN